MLTFYAWNFMHETYMLTFYAWNFMHETYMLTLYAWNAMHKTHSDIQSSNSMHETFMYMTMCYTLTCMIMSERGPLCMDNGQK